MPTSTRDLLALAKKLQQLSGDEVSLRCSISRAYYAALLATDQIFERRETDYRQDGESSHAEIIGRAKAYGNALNPGRESARTIAKILPRIRRSRNKADYRLNEEVNYAECSDEVTRAEQVLYLCEEIRAKRRAASVATP